MSRDVEAVVAERLHHLDLVLRHRPEGIIRAVRLLGRCRAVPVAAQIGGDDMEPLGQSRRDRVPRHMGQRIAVQKQQGWPVAAMAQANLRAAGLDIGERKAGHYFHELSSCRFCRGEALAGMVKGEAERKLSHQPGRWSGRLPQAASA